MLSRAMSTNIFVAVVEEELSVFGLLFGFLTFCPSLCCSPHLLNGFWGVAAVTALFWILGFIPIFQAADLAFDTITSAGRITRSLKL